jgi:hypothetical protein
MHSSNKQLAPSLSDFMPHLFGHNSHLTAAARERLWFSRRDARYFGE